jgi:pilus assembly protein Flp/PilA
MTKFITFLHAWVATHRDEDDGATMVEYGLMVALVAIVAMVGAELLGTSILAVFNDAAAKL